jgi:hypothetical protein
MDSQRAYLAGLVFGELLQHGMVVQPGLDEEGNYTDVLILQITGLPEQLRVQLRVLGADQA